MKKRKIYKGKLLDKLIKTRFVLMIILFALGVYAYLKWNLYWISQRRGEISSGAEVFIEDIFKSMLINNMFILGGIAILAIYYFLFFYHQVLTPLHYLEEKIIDVLVGGGVEAGIGKGKDNRKHLIDSLNALITKSRKKIDEYEISSKEISCKIDSSLNLLCGKKNLSAEEINKITVLLEQIKKALGEEEK